MANVTKTGIVIVPNQSEKLRENRPNNVFKRALHGVGNFAKKGFVYGIIVPLTTVAFLVNIHNAQGQVKGTPKPNLKEAVANQNQASNPVRKTNLTEKLELEPVAITVELGNSPPNLEKMEMKGSTVIAKFRFGDKTVESTESIQDLLDKIDASGQPKKIVVRGNDSLICACFEYDSGIAYLKYNLKMFEKKIQNGSETDSSSVGNSFKVSSKFSFDINNNGIILVATSVGLNIVNISKRKSIITPYLYEQLFPGNGSELKNQKVKFVSGSIFEITSDELNDAGLKIVLDARNILNRKVTDSSKPSTLNK